MPHVPAGLRGEPNQALLTAERPGRWYRLLPDDPAIGWTPYAYLVYFVPFLAFPVASKVATPLHWIAYTAGAVAFLALYFYGYWVSGRRRIPVVIAIAMLGVLFTPTNPGAISFFIYAAAFVAGIGPARVAVRWLGALLAIVIAQGWLLGLPAWTWLPPLVFVPLVGGLTIHDAEVTRGNARLRLAQEEVARLAQVAERERIGRDLHDLLGHTLSVIVLKSELASRLAERDIERAIGEIRDLERISREALAEVRRAVRGYHMSGLRDEIARARETLDAAAVEFIADLSDLSLPPLEDRALALVVREAVTNVVRHADATRCTIAVATSPRGLVLTVDDDGRGLAGPEGHGLLGMRARVEQLGGRFDISANAGTHLRVTLPALTPRTEAT